MIRAHIVDVDALGARTPAELAAYLRAAGWRVAERSDKAARWVLDTDDGEAEILQPRHQGLRDYALRIADALVTLAAVEDRSELDIMRDISASTWDVHRFRVLPPDAPPGLIAMDDGVAAHENLRALINAGAYPVFASRQRAVQPARKPQGLVDFTRSVRFGTASEGSYVLTAYLPVPPRLSEQPSLSEELGRLAPDEVPVPRRVSLRIHAAVRAAIDAADLALLTDDGLEPFTGAVDQGVSANLCEALAGLGGDDGNPFDFTLTLAATRSDPVRPQPLHIRQHHLTVLREAATELRARTPEENVEIVGEVVRLHREGRGQGGEITLHCALDDSDTLRRVWLTLGAKDYEVALAAHQQMRSVAVRGNLVRTGTRTYLSAPTGFRILPEPVSDSDNV